jgi:hypothetical protein
VPDTALRDLQQWMLAAITADGGEPPEGADAVVRSSARLSAARRLDLYRRSHAQRLVEALRAGHPALRHLLGDELFDAFALDYLRARPSRSCTLLRLGEGFADHLAATREDDGAWADLVIDLARVERAFAEVYDGPGCEGLELPPPPAAGAIVVPAPCLRLIRTAFPVGPYVRAVRAGEAPAPPRARTSRLALCRRDYVVTFTELDERGDALLAALLRGEPLPAGEDARRLAAAWTRSGFFSAIKERA